MARASVIAARAAAVLLPLWAVAVGLLVLRSAGHLQVPVDAAMLAWFGFVVALFLAGVGFVGRWYPHPRVMVASVVLSVVVVTASIVVSATENPERVAYRLSRHALRAVLDDAADGEIDPPRRIGVYDVGASTVGFGEVHLWLMVNRHSTEAAVLVHGLGGVDRPQVVWPNSDVLLLGDGWYLVRTPVS